MKYLIAMSYIWTKMNSEFNNFVKCCVHCQRSRRVKKQAYMVLVKAIKINEKWGRFD